MGKQYHIGYAKDLDEARIKYNKNINKYHGEFSKICV